MKRALLVCVTLVFRMTPLTTGDVGYHFSTEFQDATWTYWV